MFIYGLYVTHYLAPVIIIQKVFYDIDKATETELLFAKIIESCRYVLFHRMHTVEGK